MSPFAVMWISVDLAALGLVVAVLIRRDKRGTLEVRPLVLAQVIVLASAIVAATTPPEPMRSYAEWTLMVAVNLGCALTSWQGGSAARLLANTAIGFTTIGLVLVTLKSFSSIFASAMGLLFAVGALFAALLQLQQARARE
jgi:hypothetical protein